MQPRTSETIQFNSFLENGENHEGIANLHADLHFRCWWSASPSSSPAARLLCRTETKRMLSKWHGNGKLSLGRSKNIRLNNFLRIQCDTDRDCCSGFCDYDRYCNGWLIFLLFWGICIKCDTETSFFDLPLPLSVSQITSTDISPILLN